jgi:NAD(P)-dependent dehydrogenase (short-subunit alcohol dehydrogenase family)
MTPILEAHVTIITGAASGIGRACAHTFAAHGSRLILVDNHSDRLRDLAEVLGRTTDVLPLTADVTDEAAMNAMAEAALQRHGRIDHLIASAGILRASRELKTVADTTIDEWRRVIEVNLTGTFLSNRAVLPAMLAQRRGDILNLSSVSGRQGRPLTRPTRPRNSASSGFRSRCTPRWWAKESGYNRYCRTLSRHPYGTRIPQVPFPHFRHFPPSGLPR